MMWWTGRLLALVLVVGVKSQYSIPDGFQNISRVQFDKSESFVGAEGVVFHMEVDLYKDDGSILFTDATNLKTSDGKSTSIVSSGFKYLRGFKQINSTHVAVADASAHCVWMVNRAGNPNKKLLAGTCDTGGYAEGKPGRFNFPWSIELDERNPGHLLVTEHSNHALRSVEIETGTVSTVIKSGFKYPSGMAWNNGRLLVTNAHYISEVSWGKNGSVTNTRLAGSTSGGYADGEFSLSKLSSPYDITRIQDGLYLVADYSNRRLRLLDLFHQRVSPVCIGSTAPCATSTLISHPTSVLRTDDAVYVGGSSRIDRLTGHQCYAQNITVYVYPYDETANVTLDSEDVGVFPPGKYQFRRKYGSDICVFYANVLRSPIVRTAAFQSSYDVKCAVLDNLLSTAFLQSVLVHSNAKLQKICGKDCRLSSRLQPWYTCENNVLTATWPTDDVFPVDVKKVPAALSSILRKTGDISGLKSADMVILSHSPPLVPPRRDQNGETLHIVLTSACAQKSQKYQKNSDTCA